MELTMALLMRHTFLYYNRGRKRRFKDYPRQLLIYNPLDTTSTAKRSSQKKPSTDHQSGDFHKLHETNLRTLHPRLFTRSAMTRYNASLCSSRPSPLPSPQHPRTLTPATTTTISPAARQWPLPRRRLQAPPLAPSPPPHPRDMMLYPLRIRLAVAGDTTKLGLGATNRSNRASGRGDLKG
jgi:hypothetical protein